MKTLASLLIGFSLFFAIPNLHRASEIPQIFDALSIGLLIGIGLLTLDLYKDIVTSQHTKEDK